MPSHKQIQEAAARLAEQHREEGRLEGVRQGRKEILDWLEKEYLGPDAPERKSVEGNAILEVARKAAEYLRSLR